MEFISPATPEACRPKIGKPVCVVLHDGSRFYGYLHAAEEERLVLSAKPGENAGLSGKNTVKKNVRTKAVFPIPQYGYPGGLLALEWPLIALVITLPFLLI